MLFNTDTNNCSSCRWWIKANQEGTLMQCAGDNGCELTGDKFFCGN